MLTPFRRRLASAALVLLVAFLAACGFNQQTDQVYQPAVGTNDRSGTVDILGAVVVSDAAGSGTFIASLVNKDTGKADSLVSITGANLQAATAAPVAVAPQVLVNLADQAPIKVTGADVKPGGFVRLTLTFSSGQKTDVNVPVVANTGVFASVGPSASASPSAGQSANPSASPSASPAASPTSTP